MSVKPPEAHLLTAAQIAATTEFAIAHPLNPKSEVHLRRLGEGAGPAGQGVVRLPRP
jgi:hypothetical protein